MIRLPIPGSDDGNWGNLLNDFLLIEHNGDGSLKATGSLASKADEAAVVHNSGNESVSGIKTFISSPIVPSPTSASQATSKTYVDTATASKATKPIVRQAYITSGDITLVSSAGAWLPVSGLEIQLPAAVGDWVELSLGAMLQSSGTDFFDLAVLQGSTIVRRSSTGTSSGTSGDEGDVTIYPNPQNFRTTGTLFAFQVTSNDLDMGNVRFVVIAKGTGGGKIFASAQYPFRWRAINLGSVN